MRNFKKLTRSQRILLTKAGYEGDLHNVGYLKESRKYIYFCTIVDRKEFYYNKKDSKIELLVTDDEE